MMRSSRLSLKDLLATRPLGGREDDEDDEDRSTEGEQGSPRGGNGSEDEDDPDPDEDEDDAKGDPQAKIRALQKEKERHFRKRKEVEDRERALAKRLEEYERKDKSDLENAQTDLQKSLKENESLQGTVKSLALQVAFLSVNDVTWHNPQRALQLADLSEVEIGDDGTVDSKALKAAMKKLAAEEPYLVKKSKDDEDEEDETQGKNKPRERTGNPSSGSSTKEQKAKAARERLIQKYPSLRQHAG
jgi:hypothetical protein